MLYNEAKLWGFVGERYGSWQKPQNSSRCCASRVWPRYTAQYSTAEQSGLHLVSHGIAVDELARHRHDSILDDILATDDETRPYADAWYQATLWTNHYRRINNNVFEAGGDAPHNNIPPSRAIYAWFRIA